MARPLNKLSAKTAATLTATGRHSDGGGLYLSISRGGGRRWVFLYRWRGKPTELGLGATRDVPLAKARGQAADLRAMLAEGINPKVARQPQVVATFGETADSLIEAMRPGWRNKKHADQWVMTLNRYASPLRATPVADVDTAAIVAVLKPLWHRTPETAERLRGRIERVLDAAKAEGRRSGDNPARWRGHLEQLLPKRQRLSRWHHAAMPHESAPAFVGVLCQDTALAARALEFTILTALRSGEVLGARWDEIDLTRKLWSVPATRMKAGAEHRVPLSARAMQIVEGIDRSPSSIFVFSRDGGQTPLSNMAMPMLLRRLSTNVTVHGFRSTFRDWASECTGFSHDTCEAALAHTIRNKTEAAYRRGDQLEKRRELMEAWSAYCAREVMAK